MEKLTCGWNTGRIYYGTSMDHWCMGCGRLLKHGSILKRSVWWSLQGTSTRHVSFTWWNYRSDGQPCWYYVDACLCVPFVSLFITLHYSSISSSVPYDHQVPNKLIFGQDQENHWCLPGTSLVNGPNCIPSSAQTRQLGITSSNSSHLISSHIPHLVLPQDWNIYLFSCWDILGNRKLASRGDTWSMKPMKLR